MKILAISDLHGNLDCFEDYLKDIDIVCIAGDICPLNGFTDFHVHNQKIWFENNFNFLGNKYPNIQFILVPGNHDLFAIGAERFRNSNNFPRKSWKFRLPKNVHLLIDSEININDLKIYGTPWVPPISHIWAFEADNDLLKTKFKKIPYSLDILLTHSPPYFPDSKIDISEHNFTHFGNVALTQAILDKKPKYLFCGHIHTGDHNLVKIDQTKCYNVSRLNEQYNISFEPLIIEIKSV